MCGILGILNTNNKPVDGKQVEKMVEKLAHRGPDSEGLFLEGPIALAHKRLSIIDLTAAGNQPMTSADGRWVIVFNGCIYNYKELRDDLHDKGYSFVSNSDTEVISQGIAAYGPTFCKQLNGMFSIGVWDNLDQKLYLIRDRYGIKPLYYWYDGNTLIFSSEIKPILAYPEYKVEIDLESLNEYFTFQNIFSYKTLFKDIKILPPANLLELPLDNPQLKKESWWDFDFSEEDQLISFDEAKQKTKKLFEQAVKKQMVSDVAVGAYLSGGMDSGSITAVASKHVERLSTFTCGFDMNDVTGMESNFDERRDAELMANHFKTEQYEQVMNAGDIRWSLPKLVYHLEDLRLGMSYPNYYISRLASKFVKVCLQGTGGDELFGGYPWRYYRVFDSISEEDYFEQYYSYWQRLVSDQEKQDLFTPEVLQKIDLAAPKKAFKRVFTFNKKLKFDTPEDHINNSLYFEIKTFLPSLFLVGDKLSMAHGLEERFPFMDNDLVDFALKVPIRYKLGNLTAEIQKIDENRTKKKDIYKRYKDGKKLLRKAMADFIPESILNRDKQGFSAPDESWYRGENAVYIKEILLNSETLSTQYINREFIEKIVREHLEQDKNHRLLIWSFLNFEWWCRIFLNNQKI